MDTIDINPWNDAIALLKWFFPTKPFIRPRAEVEKVVGIHSFTLHKLFTHTPALNPGGFSSYPSSSYSSSISTTP